ncbi:MAG: regulatory signaling modulator protein AmpE [Gammaproteobacteria bacterium]
MTLIAALIGIFIDRLVGHLNYYRHYNYYLAWVDWVKGRLPESLANGAAGYVLAFLPPVSLIWFVQTRLSGWLPWEIFGLLFSIAVLLYCLGPRDMAADVDTYCEVCTSNDDSLRERAASRLTDSDVAPKTVTESIARVTRAVLVRANDRLFAVLFWFVVLGPVGAVVFRASSVLFKQRMSSDSFGGWVASIHGLLSWIPARLTALGYALSGHFDSALEGWRAVHFEPSKGIADSDRIIAETGLGALNMRDDSLELDDYQKPVRSAMKLVWRNLTVWLVVISLMTLVGWAT